MVCLILDNILDSGCLDRPNGLCPVCQPIFDFILTRDDDQCPDCRSQPEPHLHSSIQYHASKTTCPGCRLITSFFNVGKLKTRETPMIDLLIEQRNFRAVESYDPKTKVQTSVRYGGGLKIFLHGPNKQELVGKIVVNEAPQETSQSEDTNTSRDLVYSRGRIVPPVTNLDIIRAWEKFCCSQHEKCRRPGNGIPAAFRLIDLEHFKVVEATTNRRYVALSYVWGADTKPLLTQERLSKFSKEGGLRHADIPQTILDAMQVSRDTGYRYLWVDSICIVQDDANDKIKQLPIMGKIYSEADLVIVAAMGVSAHTGLSGIGKNTRDQWQHIEKLDGYRFITTGKDIPQIVAGTYWNSRGWTFQEAYLARRVLLFAHTQVFWICQDITWREDTNLESLQSRSFESCGLESLWGSDSNDNNWIVFDRRCRTREYCRNVELFSLRTFKDESDTLWAYAGVLQAQSALFPQRYIWGVPYEILDVALLWTSVIQYDCDCTYQESIQTPMRRGSASDVLPYTVPSWAWLSSRHSVKFRTLCGSLSSEVSWLSPVDLRWYHKLGVWEPFWALITKLLLGRLGFPSQPHPKLTDDFMEYKLLHFSAKTTNLILKLEASAMESEADPQTEDSEPSTKVPWWKIPFGFDALRVLVSSIARHWQTRDEGSQQVLLRNAKILVSDEEIGRLSIPQDYIRQGSERLGQFILLSSNTKDEMDDRCKESPLPSDCGNIIHVRDCEHVVSYNVMLIKQQGRIAYRRALGSIRKEGWAKVEWVEKEIYLG